MVGNFAPLRLCERLNGLGAARLQSIGREDGDEEDDEGKHAEEDADGFEAHAAVEVKVPANPVS